MGLLLPIEQIRARKAVQMTDTRLVAVRIPRYTDCTAQGCGFDPVTRAGRDISCTVCNGTGRVATWTTSYAWARVIYPRTVTRGFEIITTGVMGDILLSVPLEEKGLFETALRKEGSYVLVDGRKVTIITIETAALEQASSLVVACEFTRGDE